MSLFNNHDFVIVEETHNQEGRSDVFRLPERFRAFWSNGTASTAGVGIILQRDFLAKFDPVDEDRDWVEIEKGYAACLRLRGPSGALDIFCIYMPTGSGSTIYTKYRKNIMLNISNCICPKEEVLSIMAGDWNFVEHDSDRWCFETGQYTGNKDSGEAEFFKLHLSNPHGFHEWSQDHYTCEAGASRSRIDRMYCNQNLAVQLDRHITCNVLEWDKFQSAHRPLVFSRRSPKQ